MTSQKEKGHQKGSGAKELGVSDATRAVWLVKVPNYVASLWKNAAPGAELGEMKISSLNKVKDPDMKFFMSQDLAKAGARCNGGLEIPREHRMQMQDTSRQSLSSFSESVTAAETKEVLVEGKVVQRVELQPVDCPAYRKLKQ